MLRDLSLEPTGDAAVQAELIVSAVQLMRVQQAAIESAANAIAITDIQGRFLWLNPAFCHLTGYSESELLGQTPRLLKSDRHDESYYRTMWETISRGETWRGEIVNRCKDGSLYEGEETITPVRSSGDAITHFVAMFNDLTARRRSEKAERAAAVDAITRSEERYRALVDAAPSGIFVNIDNRFAYVNEAFCRIVGAEAPSQLIGTDIFQRIHPDLHPAIRARIAVASAGKSVPLMDQRFVRLDGTEVNVETVATPVILQGRTALQVIVNDISRRKKAEDAYEESQALYRSLVEQMPIGVFRKDSAGRYVFVNAWFTNLTGLSASDFIGHTAADIAQKLDSLGLKKPVETSGAKIFERGMSHHEHVMSTGSRIDTEETWILATGERRHLQVVKTPVFDANGTIVGSQGVLVDITARKIAERQLVEQRQQWSALVETSANAVFVVQDDCLVMVNPAGAAIFGASQTQLLGRSVFDFVADEYHGVVRARIQQAMMDTKPLPLLEQKLRRIDGTAIEVEASSVRFRFEGKPALLVEAREISERKRAEAELREAEGRFRQLTDNIREVFWLTDPAKEEILHISPGYEKVWGRSCASLMNSPWMWSQALHPDDRERVLAAVAKQAVGAYDEEYRIIRPDGSQRWIRDRAFPVRNGSGEVYRIAGLAEDITERKLAELRQKLQNAVSEALSRSTTWEHAQKRCLEIIGQAAQWDLGEIWIVDRKTKALRLADYWQQPGRDFSRFIDGSRHMVFPRGAGLPGHVWETGHAEWISDLSFGDRFQRKVLARNHNLRSWIGFPIKVQNEVFGVIGFFGLRMRDADAQLRDTLEDLGVDLGHFIEHRQVCEQFRQAQKMEAIGTLAGGIAHDFNNIIAGISGYTELAKLDIGTTRPDITEHLDAVLAGSARATALVRQILAFSRQQEHERQPIQLRHIIGEAMNLLRATIPATIDFDLSLGRDLPAALADPTQVHQVVMNLCTNAWHAMKHKPGRLGVKLERWQVDAEFAETHTALRPGEYIRLTVSDTGKGMDQATLDRIFEPFFTTKGPGEGTGLGLSVVHGVMQSHEGAVTAYSQLGEGTVFHLYFPACALEVADTRVAPGAIPHGNGEHVLYLDDETALVKMARSLLTKLGYKVTTCTAPRDAIDLVRAAPEQFDLVVTDLAMPAMAGTDVAQELRTIRADLPIILVTGYTATLTVARVQAMGMSDLLAKPLSVHALGTAVARVLAEAKKGKA